MNWAIGEPLNNSKATRINAMIVKFIKVSLFVTYFIIYLNVNNDNFSFRQKLYYIDVVIGEIYGRKAYSHICISPIMDTIIAVI